MDWLHRVRTCVLMCVCVVVLMGEAMPVQAQVERTTSDLTGVVRIASTSLQDTAVIRYAGTDIAYKVEYTQQPGAPVGTWRLDVYGFAPAPTDLAEAQRVLIWIDGQRHDVVDTTARTQRLDNEVLEIQTITLSAALFEGIAAADMVEVTIGAVEFDMPYPDRADMREIVDRAVSAAAAGPASRRADTGQR